MKRASSSNARTAAGQALSLAPTRRALATGAVGVLAGLAFSACGGSENGQRTLAESCTAYATTALAHQAKIAKTELRAAQGTLPEVCIVRGTIVSSPKSTINWAVELPSPAAWNGKTVTMGGGGFDGFIPTDSAGSQQRIGSYANPFVKISSDSGHQSRGFEWAVDDVALANHSYEANHMVLEVGTQIATEFYGRRPTRRYMFGHSNGGRSGIAAAQRYPHDYDGVVSLAPAISQQGHGSSNLLRDRQYFRSASNWLSKAKVDLYAREETVACDELDGLKDGVIGNIEQCKYVPTNLLCPPGVDNDSCLTAGQIESIRQTYADANSGVVLSDGMVGYPRFGRGGAATSDWQSYLFGTTFEAKSPFNYNVDWEVAKVVTLDPNVDFMNYDPTKYQAGFTRLSKSIDTTNPDLSAFADKGGKLLIWYGLADACVSVYRTAEYYDSVKKFLGESKARSFSRFITTPSTGHNMDGPNAVSIDFLAALDEWVERSTAPDNLVASKFAVGSATPTFQRPVCEYPKFPRYNGTGDPAKASSFTCSAS